MCSSCESSGASPNRGSVSLFEAALPKPNSSKEGNFFLKDLEIGRGNPQHHRPSYKRNLMLARLILEIGRDTANYLAEGYYSKFDALVKNSGCQITALQVQKVLQKGGVFKEAEPLKRVIVTELGKVEAHWEKPPLGAAGMGLTDYLKVAGIDVQVSLEMAQLVRFNLLNLVNDNEIDGGRESPKTNTDPLCLRMNSMGYKSSARTNIHYGHWVLGLQVEEAAAAVPFIQAVAGGLKGPRVEVLTRLLGDAYLRKAGEIASLPQFYTGEAALRGVKGVVLVKNKLTLCGNRIRDAKPIRVYVSMPESRVLSPEEVSAVPDNEPIVVMEGYVSKDTSLSEKVEALGLVTLFGATLAQLPQYIKGAGYLEPDEAVSQDFEEARNSNGHKLIEVDHMYCASMGEERA